MTISHLEVLSVTKVKTNSCVYSKRNLIYIPFPFINPFSVLIYTSLIIPLSVVVFTTFIQQPIQSLRSFIVSLYLDTNTHIPCIRRLERVYDVLGCPKYIPSRRAWGTCYTRSQTLLDGNTHPIVLSLNKDVIFITFTGGYSQSWLVLSSSLQGGMILLS